MMAPASHATTSRESVATTAVRAATMARARAAADAACIHVPAGAAAAREDAADRAESASAR